MAFSIDIVDSVDKLSALESLLNFNRLWNTIVDTGITIAICNVSLAITFLMTIFSILRSYYASGAKFNPANHIADFFKMTLITIFFNVPYLYTRFTVLIGDISDRLNKSIVADALFSYQIQFRSLMYSVQNTIYTSGAVSIKNTDSLSMMLSIVNNLLIGFYFCIISIGPAFLILALLTGPLCMSISIMLPSIAYNWAKFLLSAIFFTSIVAIGFMTIGDSGILQIASDYTFGNARIIAVVMIICTILLIQIIPLVVATIFHVSIYSIMSNTFAFTMSLFGLLPLAFKSIVTSEVLKKIIVKAKKTIQSIKK